MKQRYKYGSEFYNLTLKKQLKVEFLSFFGLQKLKKMNKKISIIIPYYNKINWIDQTLKSIFDQTYKNYEILIVYDDTSKKDLRYLKKLN